MRAVEITGYGGNEVLKIGTDFAKPKTGPGKVLVKVAAAGVNPVDWKIREGYLNEVLPFAFPAILGNGAVKISVARSYPVEEAAAALTESRAGKVPAKRVLTFQSRRPIERFQL